MAPSKRTKKTTEQPSKYISSTEALQLCKEVGIDIGLTLLLQWISSHPELGFQLFKTDSAWRIDRVEFQKFIHYDVNATDKQVFITTAEAQELAKLHGFKHYSQPTLWQWIKKYNAQNPDRPMAIQLHKEPRGRLFIFKNIFKEFIHATDNPN